jgi:putative MFS transporter
MASNDIADKTSILNKEIKSIQEIYEQYGYGLTTIKFLFIGGCVIGSYGVHLSLFGLLEKPFKIAYNLSTDLEEGLASSALFLGLAIGSFVLSLVKQAKYFRKAILISFCFLLTLCQVLMALIFYPIPFIIFRFIAGACIGVIVPVSYTLLTEYLPLKRRSFMLNVLWVSYTVARSIILITMLIYMPDLQVEQTQTVLLLNLIVPGVTLIACIFLVKDSPRNLILINRSEDAFVILDGMLGRSLSEEERRNVYDDVKTGMNQELEGSVCDMFSLKLLRSSISMIVVWSIHGFVFYGTFLTSSQTIIDLGHKDTSNRDALIGQFIICASLSPPVFVVGILTEIKAIGRKKTYLISYIISAIGILLATIFTSQFAILYAIGSSFMGAGMNLGNSYASEVYPTKIRGSAISFLYFISRIFVALSQVAYLWIYKGGILLPYYISVGLIIILLIGIALLPYETYNKPLDIDHSKVIIAEASD